MIDLGQERRSELWRGMVVVVESGVAGVIQHTCMPRRRGSVSMRWRHNLVVPHIVFWALCVFQVF